MEGGKPRVALNFNKYRDCIQVKGFLALQALYIFLTIFGIQC
jgi:hypothetical protein